MPAKHLCYGAAAAILIPIFFFSLLPPRCIHFAVTEGEAGSSPLSFPSLCPAFPFIALQYFPSPFYPSDPVTMFAHTPPSLLQSSSSSPPFLVPCLLLSPLVRYFTFLALLSLYRSSPPSKVELSAGRSEGIYGKQAFPRLRDIEDDCFCSLHPLQCRQENTNFHNV